MVDFNLPCACFTLFNPFRTTSPWLHKFQEKLARIAGLEPARVAPLPPQSSVSANSTICAQEAGDNEAVAGNVRKGKVDARPKLGVIKVMKVRTARGAVRTAYSAGH